jgi:hypothetical protein
VPGQPQSPDPQKELSQGRSQSIYGAWFNLLDESNTAPNPRDTSDVSFPPNNYYTELMAKFLNFSQLPPAKRVALIFGHRPKRQKHVSAFDVELASGCKAPGLFCKNHLYDQLAFNQNYIVGTFRCRVPQFPITYIKLKIYDIFLELPDTKDVTGHERRL